MAYPPLLDHVDFAMAPAATPGPNYPTARPARYGNASDVIIRSRVPTRDKSNFFKSIGKPKLRKSTSRFSGVTRVQLVIGNHSSEHNNLAHQTPPVADSFPVAFGKDEPRIAWKTRWDSELTQFTLELHGYDHVAGAPFLIHSHVVNSKPAFTKDPLQTTELKTNKQGNQVRLQWRGSMKWADFVTAANLQGVNRNGGRPFASGVLTPEYSPYMLKMTTTAAGGKEAACWPSVAWTYFQVLVARVELSFFPAVSDLDAILPATNVAETAARDRSKALYTLLLDKKDKENLKGKFPGAGETKRVALAGGKFYKSNDALMDNCAFEDHRDTWGEGPLVPILAKVLLRRNNGGEVFLPDAVGRTKLLWGYADRARGSLVLNHAFDHTALGYAETPMADPHTSTAMPEVDTLLDETADYKTAATQFSPAGRNCHFERGGKRGHPTQCIFPNSPNTFPFTVARLTTSTQKWLSTSTCGTGQYAGMSGVIFQPSRMAGDGYELQVHVAGTSDIENVARSQTAPLGKSGRFQVWRRINVLKYVKLGPDKHYMPVFEKVRQKFFHFYVDLHQAFDAVTEKGAATTFVGQVQQALNGWNGGVFQGNTIVPDWMRRAFDFTNPPPNTVFTVRPYASWRTDIENNNGGLPAAYTWARTNRPLFADAAGEEASHSIWFQSGKSVLSQPYPVTWGATAQNGAIAANHVSLAPTVNAAPAARAVPFAYDALAGTASVTVAEKAQLKAWAEQAMNAQYQRTRGVGQFYSYDPAKDAPTFDLQPTVNATDAAHAAGVIAVKAAFEEAAELVAREHSEALYNRFVGYAWMYNVLSVVLQDRFANAGESGIYLWQGHLYDPGASPLVETPAGKSEASQGERTLALNWFRAGYDSTAPKGTLLHETGHFLGVNHTGGGSSDVRDLHHPFAGSCVMMATGSTLGNHFCGVCQLRIRGWSLNAVDALGAYTAPNNVAINGIGTPAHPGVNAPNGPGTFVVNGNNIDYTAPAAIGTDPFRTEFSYVVDGVMAETGLPVQSVVWVKVLVSAGAANVATPDSVEARPGQLVQIPAVPAPSLSRNRLIFKTATSNKHPGPQPTTRNATFDQQKTTNIL